MVSCSFDTEVTQFLRACLETVDIRNEFPTYSAVWAIMKVSLLSLWSSCGCMSSCGSRTWTRYLQTHRVRGVYNGHVNVFFRLKLSHRLVYRSDFGTPCIHTPFEYQRRCHFRQWSRVGLVEQSYCGTKLAGWFKSKTSCHRPIFSGSSSPESKEPQTRCSVGPEIFRTITRLL